MDHVHTSPKIASPNDLNFLYETNYIRRAGIIPFTIYNNTTYILLGFSKEKKPVWADLGGRAEPNETTLQTALREFGEESRYVLPIDLTRINKIFITGKKKNPDQVLLVIKVDPSDYNLNINHYFQQTVPMTEYEDEMSLLQWIPYDTFLSMENLSKSMRKIQKLLKKMIIT